jgi:hypothetical protein
LVDLGNGGQFLVDNFVLLFALSELFHDVLHFFFVLLGFFFVELIQL